MKLVPKNREPEQALCTDSASFQTLISLYATTTARQAN